MQLVAQLTDWTLHIQEQPGSLLTAACNALWAHMLNLRKHDGLTHFVMLHADVKPATREWLSLLLDEMKRVEADVISAIVPIKDERGLTSTAWDTDFWRPRRLTLTEAAVMPTTWSAPDVLLNTGLMVVDVRGDWVNKIHFHIEDRIVLTDGAYHHDCAPEDWNFSRDARNAGARLYATRIVPVEHYGTGCWKSDVIQGWNTDEQNVPVGAVDVSR